MYLQQACGSPSLAKIYAAGSITQGQPATANIQGCYNTVSQLEEMVTKHTTMLHPFCSQVTTLQHFKTGFRVEWERFLPTHLIGCSADFFCFDQAIVAVLLCK